MSRKLGINILILCFSVSNVNFSWATDVVPLSPVIVQPYEVQELTQQMLARDRQNRDEETAIQGLIEENNKLTQNTLASQEDEGLQKINQTMLAYRHAVNSNETWPSRYGDLVRLTEDADAMTVHQDLVDRRDLVEQKYKLLSDLKDEMTALNEKLEGEGSDRLNQKDTIITGFKNIAQQEEDKIQTLTQQLEEMDQKIAHSDEILAEKDEKIAQLKDNLARLQSEAATQDEIIKEQKNQIDILQKNSEVHPAFSASNMELPPIVVNSPGPGNQQQAVPGSNQLADLQRGISARDELIKQQQDQIAILKAQPKNMPLSNVPSSPVENMGNMALPPIIVNSSSNTVNPASSAREEELEKSVRWLNQVLAATRDKAEYYRLTSQRDRMTVEDVQRQVQDIKDNFARHLKDYNQFEVVMGTLKNQVSQLDLQLSQKQNEVDALKSELEDQTDLKNQIQDKEDQIAKMKSDLGQILQAQANKEIYNRKAAAVRLDDRIGLAKELIGLHEQEASLLNEKSDLEATYNVIFDQHVVTLENKIEALFVNRQVQTAEMKDRLEELKSELEQNDQQVEGLKAELENKMADEKSQNELTDQIQDLKAQLQDKDNQITSMKSQVQSGQVSAMQADTLRQQVMAEEDKENLLKAQLDNKIDESNRMTVMIQNYQRKLESKNNAYNEQFGQVLSAKNDRAQMEKQIADLNEQLQAKDLSLSIQQQKMMDEKISDYQIKVDALQATNVRQLQEITSLRTELALARQQLDGMPSSDEIDFLRAGLKKATVQLKQRDDMLARTEANAGEYAKSFNEQSREFQNLKDQLQDAQENIERKDEDLKYKDMAITRLKDMAKTRENTLSQQTQQLNLLKSELENKITREQNQGGVAGQVADLKAQLQDKEAQIVNMTRESQALKDQLQETQAHFQNNAPKTDSDLRAQVVLLTQKINIDEKKLQSRNHEGKADVLQAQLDNANEQIKDLRKQLDQFEYFYRKDIEGRKLKQALDKVDQQGRVINILVRKLRDSGHPIDLTKEFSTDY